MAATDIDVMVVIQDPIVSGHIVRTLVELGQQPGYLPKGEQALSSIAKHAPKLVFAADDLPDMSLIDLISTVKLLSRETAIVLILSRQNDPSIHEHLAAGAIDVLMANASPNRISEVTAAALNWSPATPVVMQPTTSSVQPRTMNTAPPDPQSPIMSGSTLGQNTSPLKRTERFLGHSSAMREVFEAIESASGSTAPVFVCGESGTGKELTAQAIHQSGPRATKPFVALNCAAIPRNLMESELFGHKKGAFTGATTDRFGAASRAHGGTLFLDELAEMPIDLQAKLLRFLQTGQILPVGGTEERTVDVRLIAATNRPPRSAIDDGLLREDLFYRLYVIPIELPPLRNRGDDVLTIAEHYLTLYSRCEGRSFKEISADAKEQIRNHPWPGNVRQLQNAIRRAVVMNDSDVLTADMLLQDSVLSGGSSLTTTATSQPEDRMPASMLRVSPQNPVVPFRLRLPRQDDRPSQLAPSIQSIRPLWLVEKEAIEAAVTACGGNVVKAAAFLEIAPSTIYRKLQTWEKQS